ncbi:MAG: prohibitin family protein [Oscillospiraceae bacterium]|jgi:regulator of protease activity HflC (stomatin/prohibitin superfamily)|nr:prohibitin family protein [Oscillospiraceae bacterium]
MSKKVRTTKRKTEWVVIAILIVLLMVILWPFVTTTISAGHVGAYYSVLFGGTLQDVSLNEGLRFRLPWDRIVSYDARAMSKSYTISAMVKGGMTVNVEMTALWYIHKDRVAELHSTMGANYIETVIDPAITAALRSAIGRYEQGQLYNGNPIELQNDTQTLLNQTLERAPFFVHSIMIREVKFPPEMTASIEEKFVAEQNVLSARYKTLEAFENFKRGYVNAEAERLTQSIVSDGMSEAYLRYIGIKATTELAQSNNAKLVIIGDKDGLPLILNPDTLTTSETLPSGITSDDYTQKDGSRAQEFFDTYSRLQAELGTVDALRAAMLTMMPESEVAIGAMDTLTPQVNSVPAAASDGASGISIADQIADILNATLAPSPTATPTPKEE